jgi:hypothetical protein
MASENPGSARAEFILLAGIFRYYFFDFAPRYLVGEVVRTLVSALQSLQHAHAESRRRGGTFFGNLTLQSHFRVRRPYLYIGGRIVFAQS